MQESLDKLFDWIQIDVAQEVKKLSQTLVTKVQMMQKSFESGGNASEAELKWMI